MKNKVGREIPEEFLQNGVEVFQGQYYRDNYESVSYTHLRAHET